MQRKPSRPTMQQIFLNVVREAIEEKETEQPKENIQAKLIKEYEALQKRKEKKYKAYKVVFDGVKDLVFISFQVGDVHSCRYKAEAEATKFFKENFHPVFMSEEMLLKARGYRIHELDKYCKEGKAPIPVLMKAGLRFPCQACGKGNFDYEDYEFRRCYITEETDYYPYAKGVVLCKKCFDKYMGNR